MGLNPDRWMGSNTDRVCSSSSIYTSEGHAMQCNYLKKLKKNDSLQLMAALPLSLSHFAHHHQLTKHNQDTAFICDGCNLRGEGPRYRCHHCDFDLDYVCATCPADATVSFFMHPSSTLHLHSPDPRRSASCYVCRGPIGGSMVFRCLDASCDFHAHPLCVQLPRTLGEDMVHPGHGLTCMDVGGASTCGSCRSECRGWRYRCAQGCGVDFHIQCIQGPAAEAIGDGGGRGDEGESDQGIVEDINDGLSFLDMADKFFNIISNIAQNF